MRLFNHGSIPPLASLALVCLLSPAAAFGADQPHGSSTRHGSSAVARNQASAAAIEASVRSLVNRELQAWMSHDFSVAAADWLPDAELVSPGGHVKAGEIQPVITDYFKHFRDLHVTVKRVFVSADGKNAAIEWDWEVTRIRDGKHGITHDAILVELEGNRIRTWSEFFDLGNSVDAEP